MRRNDPGSCPVCGNALEPLRRDGIRIVMVTGDHRATAESAAHVRTHMAIQGLMGCAVRGRSRSALITEAWRLLRGSDMYRGSKEELTPIGLDPLSLIPVAYVALRLLVAPSSAGALARRTGQSHQLNRAAMRIIDVMS